MKTHPPTGLPALAASLEAELVIDDAEPPEISDVPRTEDLGGTETEGNNTEVLALNAQLHLPEWQAGVFRALHERHRELAICNKDTI